MHAAIKTVTITNVCGQNSCPGDFTCLQTMCAHIMKVHRPYLSVVGSSCKGIDYHVGDENEYGAWKYVACMLMTMNKCHVHAPELWFPRHLSLCKTESAAHNAANFVVKLRSNMKIPLCPASHIIDDCKDFYYVIMDQLNSYCATI